MGEWGNSKGIKMRKLTQSVLRIIKFYLALVQTTGLIAFGYRNPEGRIIDEKYVGVGSECYLSTEEYFKSTHLNVYVCYGTNQQSFFTLFLKY